MNTYNSDGWFDESDRDKINLLECVFRGDLDEVKKYLSGGKIDVNEACIPCHMAAYLFAEFFKILIRQIQMAQRHFRLRVQKGTGIWYIFPKYLFMSSH
jgi:hypothetical protein